MDARGVALAEGLRAVQEARWAEARERLEAALADGPPVAAGLDGLAQALWFLGDGPGAIAARARAFDAHLDDGDPGGAATSAVWISHQHSVRGRRSAASGWLARAETVLDGVPECPGSGWVAVERARRAPVGVEQARCAREAVAIARRTRDTDLEVFATSLLGRAEVAAGHPVRGMALLEEAMVAATSGRVRNTHTLGEAYCNLVMACADAGDWERATEWCEHVDAFARTVGAAPLVGACRAVHADVLLTTGHWSEAEAALESALDVHAHAIPELGDPAAALLAELRVRQGRLTEAAALLADRAETPSSLRALALLRLAQDRAGEAVALLERGLRGSAGDTLRTSRLLATLVDAELASGALAAAADAAHRLGEAATDGLRLTAALSGLASARVAHAAGRPDDAAEPSRRALAEFLVLAMPLDAASARLELARALAPSARETAADEARVARSVFDGLGATASRAAAERLLASLAAVRAPRGLGALTDREREVLDLVARGLTNARIAQALVITEKTAGHHVSNILAKLGVRNRTEAAARLVASRS
ncbi:LuxR family transcriptional regulator [Nocardioides dongxiaopingii]|uniref:LuxR C-terminal-related transcriptional regulator n=1 Tax=Nocardioides sp. S-1144 TaxID=2582905 RepID=UPI001163A706|nr:LuxR C-terminal-related transcriptional regulator [Nocardioides sp. S-1144]QDH10728.1 LuxR family transcriptional regulator [Nocardioides sp. S-1144]